MSKERQKHILNFVREKGEVKRSEIIDRFDYWYHHNSGHYISEILFRMINNGKLTKVKRGVYTLGSGVKPELVNENQTNLFNQ